MNSQFGLATLPHFLGKYGYCGQSVIEISAVGVQTSMTSDNNMKITANGRIIRLKIIFYC